MSTMVIQGLEKLNIKEDNVNKNDTDVLLNYCTSEFCEGLPVNVVYKEIEGDVVCPICYDSLNSGKVSMLDKCSHLFCLNCVEQLGPK